MFRHCLHPELVILSAERHPLAARYTHGLQERLLNTFKLDSARVQNLHNLDHGLWQLVDGFLAYHARMSQRISVDKDSDGKRSEISQAIVKADPILLGLPVVSEEFDNFIIELLCSIFGGCARSLRSALEVAIVVAEFSIDPTKLHAQEILSGLSSGQFSEETLLMSMPISSLMKRFRSQKKLGTQVSFAKSVEDLANAFEPDSTPTRDILKVHSELSRYAHFSMERFMARRQAGARVSEGSGEQLSHSTFLQFYDLALEVVDIVFLLLVRAESRYLQLPTNSLIAEIGEWTPGREIITQLDIIREREFFTRKVKLFHYSYPLIETVVKKIRLKR